MLSQETLNAYRQMSLSERLKLVLEMRRANTAALCSGPPEVVRRRFELIRLENDARNANILAAFARLKDDKAGDSGSST